LSVWAVPGGSCCASLPWHAGDSTNRSPLPTAHTTLPDGRLLAMGNQDNTGLGCGRWQSACYNRPIKLHRESESFPTAHDEQSGCLYYRGLYCRK
jgi:hypothetical protein